MRTMLKQSVSIAGYALRSGMRLERPRSVVSPVEDSGSRKRNNARLDSARRRLLASSGWPLVVVVAYAGERGRILTRPAYLPRIGLRESVRRIGGGLASGPLAESAGEPVLPVLTLRQGGTSISGAGAGHASGGGSSLGPSRPEAGWSGEGERILAPSLYLSYASRRAGTPGVRPGSGDKASILRSEVVRSAAIASLLEMPRPLRPELLDEDEREQILEELFAGIAASYTAVVVGVDASHWPESVLEALSRGDTEVPESYSGEVEGMLFWLQRADIGYVLCGGVSETLEQGPSGYGPSGYGRPGLLASAMTGAEYSRSGISDTEAALEVPLLSTDGGLDAFERMAVGEALKKGLYYRQ